MNRELLRAAFRAPLFAMITATTGLISLSATASGYARLTGSFKDDGFALGMSVVPVGFPQSTAGVIASLTDLTMTIKGGRTVAAAAGSRSLVAGLPASRVWDAGFTESVGSPFVEDELSTGPRSREAIGDSEEDHTGIYYVRYYGTSGVGDEAIERFVRACLALYPIGHAQTLSDGSVLRIRGYAGSSDVAPVASGSILPYNTGWRVLPVSIPWRLTTTPL